MKKIFGFLAALAMTVSSFALPGIKNTVPESNGEFIFYTDTTFKTESLVGICKYDDATWGMRYYSPETKKQAENDINLVITIDPESDTLNFTGEAINGMTDNSQVDIVNYLHDIFYEFTERRAKVEVWTEPFENSEDYPQFGGKVKITYDPMIPFFNIREIALKNNSPLLSIVTMGKLEDSEDKSFLEFKGFDLNTKSEQRKISKGKIKCYLFHDGQSVKADEAWETKIDGLWTLGDSAILHMTSMEVPADFFQTEIEADFYLKKNLLRGTKGNLPVLSMTTVQPVKKNSDTERMETVFLQDGNTKVRVIQLITFKKGNVHLLNLSIYDADYQKNKGYFDSILKSYKIN